MMMEELEKQTQENPSWLKEIAQKSWEPELLVSGAAIYLTSNLPAWIDHLDNYYTTDILSDMGSSTAVLPLLAFSFLKLMSYMLLFAFVGHFMMRAFWVATVGLLSVFPQDINYDNLPNYSDEFKLQLKNRLGSLQDYVNRLDKTCSSLLSIAFLTAITLFGISFMYFVGFGIIQLISILTPADRREDYENIGYFVFLLIIMVLGVGSAILNIPAMKNKPFVAKLQFKIYVFTNNLFFPLINKAIQRISFIFVSNIPRKRYYMAIAIFSVMLIVLLPFNFKSGILVERFSKMRLFYSEESPSHFIDSDYYESSRNPQEPIIRVTIPSEMIEGKFLKVFLSYPKRLDKELGKYCSPLEVADTLKKQEASKLKDLYSLACLDKFFTISVNDSIYSKELLFYRHHTTKELGLLTYVPTNHFREGKNLLKIVRYHSDSTKADRNTFEIPFWYAPD